VSTPVGCAISLVRHEETGLTVPARNAAALAAALARLLADGSLRARLADAAFRRVREMSWTRTATQTLGVYERALNGNQVLAHA
jgi:glycosyltransferase involved in cell wall biosynthesis